MFIKLVAREALSVEADVERVQNGDLVLFCTCGGLTEPAPENRTLLFRSFDNGRTWTAGTQLCEENGLANYQTETAVLGEKLLVFVSEHDGRFIGWKNFLMESEDGGFTFRKRELEALPGYAFVRGMVRLSDGKVMFPYHAYPITPAMEAYCRSRGLYVWTNAVPYVENGFLITEDGGKTFRRQTAFCLDMKKMKAEGYPQWIWPENTVVEAEPGHLIMLFRVDTAGFLWRSDSRDGGQTWSEPEKTSIPNPSNKPRLFRTESGKIVLANTPNSARGLEERHPLELWISEDGLKSWSKKIRLSDFPGAYSYPSGFTEGETLYLAFEFNRHDIYFSEIDLDGNS